MGLRGSHGVGREDGERLALIREEHVGLGPCRQPQPPPWTSWVSPPPPFPLPFPLLLLLLLFVFSLLVSEGDYSFSVDAQLLGFHTRSFTTATGGGHASLNGRPTSHLKFGPLMKSQIPQRLPRET